MTKRQERTGHGTLSVCLTSETHRAQVSSFNKKLLVPHYTHPLADVQNCLSTVRTSSRPPGDWLPMQQQQQIPITNSQRNHHRRQCDQMWQFFTIWARKSDYITYRNYDLCKYLPQLAPEAAAFQK